MNSIKRPHGRADNSFMKETTTAASPAIAGRHAGGGNNHAAGAVKGNKNAKDENFPLPRNCPAPETLKTLYRSMALIRLAEQKIAELYPEQEIRSPVHLYIGQEAIAAGVCLGVGKEAYLFGTYRGHGIYLARGGSLKAMFAELYGKEAGCCKGRGGSMHLAAPEVGLMGCSAIVGGTIPAAVGAALAARLRKTGHVAVAFFGDGAADEGTLHESMNFAALKKLPVLFVCENNFYATHSPQLARQPLDNLYKRAEVYGMPGVCLDGNDAVEVYLAAERAAARARRGGGPTFMECRTYRWKGHVGPEVDFQLGYRGEAEFEKWRRRDPLALLEGLLRRERWIAGEELQSIHMQIGAQIAEAVQFAKEAPFPEIDGQEGEVYAP